MILESMSSQACTLLLSYSWSVSTAWFCGELACGDDEQRWEIVCWEMKTRNSSTPLQIATPEKDRIRVLMRDDIQHYENSVKLTIAVQFFTSLFGQESLSLPVIDTANLYDQLDISMLDEPISWAETEIVDAINRSPGNRSPGPDGFFFREFHENTAELPGINSATIVLLPKKEAEMDIRDFRPISLVHSIPKLATKVLAIHLQWRIPILVHPLHSDFQAGRCIVENFFFASAAELVQQTKRRKKPMIVLFWNSTSRRLSTVSAST